VIAILPKLGAGEANAIPSSSHIPLANKAVDQSFSTVLEQTKSSLAEPPGALQPPSQFFVRETYSSVNGLSKRDARSSDTTSNRKTNDSPDRGTSMDKIPAPISDDQDRNHQIALQPPPQTFPRNTGITDFASVSLVTCLAVNGAPPSVKVLDDAARNEKVTQIPISGANSIPKTPTAGPTLPALSHDPVLSKPQEKTKGARNEANAETSIAASGIATDSEVQPGSAPAISEAGNTLGGNDQARDKDHDHKAQAVAKSEIEQVSVPVNVALPAVVAPATGPKKMDPGNTPGVAPPAVVAPTAEPKKIDLSKSRGAIPLAPIAPTLGPRMDAGKSLGAEVKPAIDKSRTMVTQDASGTTRKSVEVTEGAKSQPHKEDSPSPDSSQASDQTTIISAKAIEPFTALSVAGNQSSMTPADGANPIRPVSSDAVDRQPGHLDQNSSSAAESQAPAEIVSAYPASLVHSAKLVERIGEAELRLGIRAGEFGSVDIRTSMVRNQFTAEIAVERGELGRVMTAELHGLQSRLIDQGIPEVSITVHNHTGGQSTASEQQKPRNGPEMYSTNPVNGRDDGPMTTLVASEATSASSRLDIHM
jgi:hypothetical protein